MNSPEDFVKTYLDTQNKVLAELKTELVFNLETISSLEKRNQHIGDLINEQAKKINRAHELFMECVAANNEANRKLREFANEAIDKPIPPV